MEKLNDNTTSVINLAPLKKGVISILEKRGHLYFGLTQRKEKKKPRKYGAFNMG
jgi:hypothetical protein